MRLMVTLGFNYESQAFARISEVLLGQCLVAKVDVWSKIELGVTLHWMFILGYPDNCITFVLAVGTLFGITVY